EPVERPQVPRAGLHQLDAEEEHTDAEDNAAERLPQHFAAEDEHGSREAEAIQNKDLQVENAGEDKQRGPDIRPEDDRERLANGDESGGRHAGQNDGDGRGALHADAGQEPQQTAAPDAVGEACDQTAELPAAGLLEVVADEVQAQEEEAESGDQLCDDFGHGGPYLNSTRLRGKPA